MIMAITCSLVWGIWPILSAYSKASANYINLAISCITALFIIFALFFERQFISTTSSAIVPVEDPKMFWLPIVGGVLNGIGILLYGILLSKDSGFDSTKYVVIVTACLPAVAAVTGYFLLGWEITWQKVLGILMVITGVYMINRK